MMASAVVADWFQQGPFSDPKNHSGIINFTWTWNAYGAVSNGSVGHQDAVKTDDLPLSSAAHLGLVTGLLLALVLNTRTDAIKTELRCWEVQAAITRVLIALGCPLLSLLVMPIAGLTLLALACYRRGVHLALALTHGKSFVDLLDGTDAVWALENDASRSVINVLGIIEVDGAKDQLQDVLLDSIRKLVCTRLMAPPYPCPKLLYYRRQSALGYFYWERQEGLDIEDHVRWMVCDSLETQDEESISQPQLRRLVSEFANTPLPADHASCWEILVGKQQILEPRTDPYEAMEEGISEILTSSQRYPVLFRVHHSLGDGTALLQLLMNTLVDGYKTETTPFSTPLRSKMVNNNKINTGDAKVSISETSSTTPKIVSKDLNCKNKTSSHNICFEYPLTKESPTSRITLNPVQESNTMPSKYRNKRRIPFRTETISDILLSTDSCEDSNQTTAKQNSPEFTRFPLTNKKSHRIANENTEYRAVSPSSGSANVIDHKLSCFCYNKTLHCYSSSDFSGALTNTVSSSSSVVGHNTTLYYYNHHHKDATNMEKKGNYPPKLDLNSFHDNIQDSNINIMCTHTKFVIPYIDISRNVIPSESRKELIDNDILDNMINENTVRKKQLKSHLTESPTNCLLNSSVNKTTPKSRTNNVRASTNCKFPGTCEGTPDVIVNKSTVDDNLNMSSAHTYNKSWSVSTGRLHNVSKCSLGKNTSKNDCRNYVTYDNEKECGYRGTSANKPEVAIRKYSCDKSNSLRPTNLEKRKQFINDNGTFRKISFDHFGDTKLFTPQSQSDLPSNRGMELLKTISKSNIGRYESLARYVRAACALVFAPASLIHQTLMKATDANSLHGANLSGQKVVAWYTDDSKSSLHPLTFDTIKRIKHRMPEARFTDVFLAALSASLESYFAGDCSDGKVVPESITVVVPARMEHPPEDKGNSRMIQNVGTRVCIGNSEPDQARVDEQGCLEMNNHFSVAMLKLPITASSQDTAKRPLSRLGEVCRQSDLLRRSSDYQINYYLMRVVATYLPVPLLAHVLHSAHSTLVVSNIKGPTKNLRLDGCKLTDIVFWVPNRGTTGVGVSLMSYAGRIQTGIVVDRALVSNQVDAQRILDRVVSELHHLDNMTAPLRNAH